MRDRLATWFKYQQEFGENLVLTKDEDFLKQTQIAIAKIPASVSTAKVERKNEMPVSQAVRSRVKPVNANVSVSPKQPLKEGSFSLSAESLEKLKQELCAYEGCALKAMAQTTVFADGDPTSRLMFIGEAPGAEEDKQGLPFVGQSGQLLNKMIESIGLTRERVYITNVVNWRPPGNRPPTQEEIDQCWPFLTRHIELISPKLIVLLGSTAMKAVLKLTHSLSQARGFFHNYQLPNGEIKVLVTFHPSYLLRVPAQKRAAWQDFLMIKEYLER
jgi:DNA polymerase